MKSDTVFISDAVSQESHNNIVSAMGNFKRNGFNKPLFINFQNKTSHILIPIDTLPDKLLNKSGIIKARKQFLHALKYSVENFDIKIVLLAASTKRLFGKEIELRVNWEGKLDDNGFTLREFYPNTLFTNGDNGTSSLLELEIESISKKKKIKPENKIRCLFQKEDFHCSGAIVINGLGLLGTNSLKYLIGKNYCENQIVIISNHTNELQDIIGERDISVFSHLSKISGHNCIGKSSKIKLIINTTHNPSQLITAESISKIQNGQSIGVIDVAVPYGFPEEEFHKCNNVFRQDGGNAYVEEGLEYFFNPVICGLSENLLYVCFAETIALSTYLKGNPKEIENIRKLNLFNVNKATKDFVKSLFEKYGIGISPNPFSYNKRIDLSRIENVL